MKKNLLLAAMAAAAMTSCSNDDVIEVNQGDKIAFQASMEKLLTRATVESSDDMGIFNVTAIGNGTNYFTDLTVTKGGTGWDPAITYYWPSYALNFYAYAPVKATDKTPDFTGTVQIANGAKQIVGFSPEQTVSDQKDLLISCNNGQKLASVPMNFKHALSQIEVKAKKADENVKIEVIGVKLVNLGTKANFTFPEAKTEKGYNLTKAACWSDPSEKDQPAKAYMVKGSTAKELGTTAESIMFGTDNFMVIPQKMNPWGGTAAKTGAYLSVLCRISVKNGANLTQIYPQPAAGATTTDTYAFSAVPITPDWEPGKKYTYTLTFCDKASNAGAGKIDPNPETPDGTDSSNVETTPGTGGTPILGDAIKFTVTVDTWTAGTDQSANM